MSIIGPRPQLVRDMVFMTNEQRMRHIVKPGLSGLAQVNGRNDISYPVRNFEVSGDKIEAIHMLPGYTHNIINLSETENLVTVMWANESFDPNHPDTFFEKVEA